MKQVITQHGWGFDQSIWDGYKSEFNRNKWLWQDNERGYFSNKPHQSKWIKNNSTNNIKLCLCHSLGFHLIKKSLLKEASHIIFINSFNNFLPSSSKRNMILNSLKSMERKIIQSQTKDMLRKFIDRSFMPNIVNSDLQNKLNQNIKNINNALLLNDLKKLYVNRNLPDVFNKNCKVVFIQSENDLIVDKESINDFVELLKKKKNLNTTLIKISNQGHCLSNFNLFEIINNNLNN